MEIILKVDEHGNVVRDTDGNPVYIFKDKDGEREAGVDVAALHSKIAGLNKESADRRHRIKEIEGEINLLREHGIKQGELEDFVKSAKSNAEKIQNFNEKDMKSLEEVEKIKRGVTESYETKIKEMSQALELTKQASQTDLQNKDQVIRNLLIKGAFNKSDFIKEKTVLTPDIAFNTFGQSFKVEEVEGKDPMIVALDSRGEKIFSKTKPGDYADPEEAIEILIKAYPQSEAIMRSSKGGDAGKPFTGKQGTGKFSAEALAGMSATERLKFAHNLKKPK